MSDHADTIRRLYDLQEELRLMPLGVSRSEAYGIVERWHDDDGHIKYGRDLAEYIGAETNQTAAQFTELIVLALNVLPSLLAERQQAIDALRAAPAPLTSAETGLDVDEWDDAYAEWWDANAAALVRLGEQPQKTSGEV